MGLVKRTYVDGETVITADNLNDIQDEIIQNEEDIATKGTYSKPTGGIPKTDLASAVQTSLGKADTALQSSDIDNTLTVSGKAADAKKTGDEISGVKNTLNHKADVIYDTASGDIASFPDGADDLPVKDLTVGIEPVQSGTGDPSPTNVRPISGWTGANVSRTGKNLLPELASKTELGITFTEDDNGILTMNGTTSAGGRIFLWQGELIVKEACILSIGTSAPNFNFNMGVSGNNNAVLVNNGTGIANVPPGKYTSVSVYVGAAGTQYDVKMYPMLRLASDSDTTFVQYQGTTIPISWQSEAGTVYGGTLDVTSGVLTVTDGYVDLGTLSGTYNASTKRWAFYINGMKSTLTRGDFILSDKWATDTSAQSGSEGKMFAYGGAVYLYTSDGENSPTGQLVYELATPQTYQLTPQEVTTLLGQNNIWADCGPSTVEYPADTKLYIDKKLAALVAALS